MTKTITAVDIWMDVLQSNEYKLTHEKSRAGDDINLLEFFKEKKVITGWSRHTTQTKCSVYFNYKTGEVSNVFFSNDDKDYFISQFESKLRDYKLKSILD